MNRDPIQLVIIMSPDGRVFVNGSFNDKELALRLVKTAKNIITNYKPGPDGIVIPNLVLPRDLKYGR